MKLINLTPHTICLPNNKDLLPSGYVSRLNILQSHVDTLDGIPILESKTTKAVNLPDAEPDVYFIVPALVRCAMPDRQDLLSPTKLLRNEHGIVMGCGALERNPKC